MAKAKKTIFFCQQCGYETAKWMGQCPGCREWNTFVEEPAEEKQCRNQHRQPAEYPECGTDAAVQSRNDRSGAFYYRNR